MTRIAKHRKKLLTLLAIVLVSLGVFVVRDQPIARAAPHAVATPAPVTASVRACWVEFARNEAPGLAGTAGFTRAHEWNVTVAGLLVRHPKGDVVIDVGNSSAFAQEIEGYGPLDHAWLMALPGSNRRVALAPDALRAAGADPDHLTAIITHMHPDHAGGLVDLPNTRVLLPREELAFAESHESDHDIHVVAAEGRALAGRTDAIAFEPRPYETFDESADIFGDGSVVVVKLFGHTPGSVGVFVNVSPTKRYFHVGDAVNLVEAVERRVTKSFVMTSTDVDRAAADRTVARIAQLHEAAPEIAILPAHDRAAWTRSFGQPNGCASN
jgi:glyoxylase-like metal-dependent hydrolase (beta-lactamase superfamily II)